MNLHLKIFILSIKISSSVGKVVFRLIRNVKSADFPHIASSLLKLKSKFHSSKLELNEKDPDKLI